MIKFKNIKAIYTDLVGAAIMAGACYLFYKGTLDLDRWGILMGVGFILLWMDDEDIMKLLKKAINIIFGIFKKKAESVADEVNKPEEPK